MFIDLNRCAILFYLELHCYFDFPLLNDHFSLIFSIYDFLSQMSEEICANQTISFHKLFLFLLKRMVFQLSFMKFWVVICILAAIN